MTDLAAAVDRLMIDSGCNPDHPAPPSSWRDGPTRDAVGFGLLAEAWKHGVTTLESIRARQIAERRPPRCVP